MSIESPAKLLTVAEFLERDFDVPVELVRGEIVEMTRPGWRHGAVCGNIAYVLGRWVREVGRGLLATNDTGVITERDPDTLRGPDVFFVAQDRIPAEGIPAGVPEIVPNLCVEVLSPTDRWTDVLRKVAEYHEAGVREVWVIDPEDRVLQLFRSDSPTVQFRRDQVVISRELPGFECSLTAIFEGV